MTSTRARPTRLLLKEGSRSPLAKVKAVVPCQPSVRLQVPTLPVARTIAVVEGRARSTVPKPLRSFASEDAFLAPVRHFDYRYR